MRRLIKNCVFTAYAAAAGWRGNGKRRVVAFVYHRVTDALRDSVTVGVRQFATQIRYLSDHYQIVRLEDVVAADAAAEGAGPVVAITFDDGYLDNYENAAPILAKHRVHATFFVSTDHIEHNLPFEHDLQKLGYGLPNMSWDHIREMRAGGFSFGSHTAQHANLAQIDAETAREELIRSKAALERELRLDRVMFAYPFGKREDITPERRRQIQEVGYACNCSAYGGANEWPLDRWNIQRIGVNHQFDLPALKARIAGWKSSAAA